MAFDNHYPNRKDNRRNYKYNFGKSVDRSCRNHGGCPFCISNRRISWYRRLGSAIDQVNEFFTVDKE